MSATGERDKSGQSGTALPNLPAMPGMPAMTYRAEATPERRLIHVSAGAEGLTGRTAESLLAEPGAWTALVHAKDAAALTAEVKAALAEGRGFVWAHRIIHASGAIRWVLDRCALVTDECGSLAFEGLVCDVSELQRNEAFLREGEARSEAQFYNTFNAARIGLAHVRLDDGRWLRVNERLCEILGYPREELLALTFHDLTHPEDLGSDLEQLRQLLAGETQTYSMEKRYIRKNGEVFWSNLSASLIRRPSGEPDYGIAVVEDISERKRAEAVLRENQERLRVAQVAGGVGLYDMDLATRVARCSEQFFHVIGRRPSPDGTLTFAEWESWVHPEDRARAVAETEAALAGAASRVTTEHRVLGEQGEVHWVFTQAEIHRDAWGQALRKVGSIQDITARRQVEDQIRWAHDRLRKVLDSMFAFVWVLSADGTLIEANQAPIAAAGLNRAELIGKKFWDCPWWSVEPEARARLRAAFERAQHGETIRYDETIATAHAGRLTVDFMLQPVFRAGELDFMIPSAVDITDRKRAEEALKQSDQRKDEFLATLAHELRNPLAPLLTGFEVMKRSPDQATFERTRAMMERQLGHMVRLIDDLLDVSRIGRGKLTLERAPLSLAQVVEHAVETSRPIIEAADHRLTIHAPDEPVWVEGDRTRLAQVVANLLTNSAKYTPSGGQIDLTIAAKGDHALLRVADNGIGITPELLPRVFDLFAQSTHPQGRAQGGLGIGLSLVRRLVELHGGTVTAQSPGAGRGSVFTVRLPLAQAGQKLAKATRPAAPPAITTRRRVLVVDDNEDAAEMLATMLDLQGYETRTAHDGPGALRAVQSFAPEVVFLDIGLPGMSGHEVAERVRADPAQAQTVLVALTGWGGSEDKRRTKDAGFDFHLTKPVDLAAIEDVLNQSLERRGQPH